MVEDYGAAQVRDCRRAMRLSVSNKMRMGVGASITVPLVLDFAPNLEREGWPPAV